MTERTIIAGDSYETLRPLFRIPLTNIGGGAMDLTGCTVRTTFKPEADDDLTDAAAVIKADAVIDGSGVITDGTGLVLADIIGGVYTVVPATSGVLLHLLTEAESAAIPVDTPYVSDVQATVPIAGGGTETFTFIFTDTLIVVNGITNRSTP